MNRRVIIVGGGVIGLSLAWELCGRGCSVTLIDRGQVGKATSWSAAGILPSANFARATDPIDRLRGQSHELFPSWASRLAEVTSIDIGLRRCGGWFLADTPGERALMTGMVNYWAEFGVECRPVTMDSLADLEPALASWADQTDDAAAWWVPDEYQIRPPRYLQALTQACRHGGVEIIENASVVDVDSGKDARVLVGDRWHQADSVVLCGGAWTGLMASRLNLEHAIVPIRGQILLLKTQDPVVQSIVNLGNRYVVCRDDGYTLIGSCEEEVGFSLGTDDQVLESLLQFATSLLPELKTAERIDAWSGFRPMTFDGFPMIGPVPGHDNLYVAAGHYRSGIHLSPGTAIAMADLILGEKPLIDLDMFRVGKQTTTDSPRGNVR